MKEAALSSFQFFSGSGFSAWLFGLLSLRKKLYNSGICRLCRLQKDFSVFMPLGVFPFFRACCWLLPFVLFPLCSWVTVGSYVEQEKKSGQAEKKLGFA